ncbi:MAG: hypothetical protein Ct9H300mP19_02200 [Dehalococcoidia bacterium]|nr:MAG: hypothetical protein Ct9H300mP19_02200 [Dehalococcoidia bacterium]
MIGRAEEFFNRPTDVAIHPETGELFVSDGYGNSRIHKFDPDGQHMSPGVNLAQIQGNSAFLITSACLVWTKWLLLIEKTLGYSFFTTGGEFVEQIHIHHPMSVPQRGKVMTTTCTSGDDSPACSERGFA